VEYERLCSGAEREIWPSDFIEAYATVTADMAALQQRTVNTKGAASQVVSLASQARQL
jgi:energy-coupling factor transporter transmembrane protein EcfT